MTNKTLTGLEAVLLLQEGGYITDGQHIYRFVNTKIEASDIASFNKGKPEWKSGNVFNFNFDQYEEYTKPKPLTGWERVKKDEINYYIDIDGLIEGDLEIFGNVDNRCFNVANYFSTKEKAEEINFKQTLFRKLQRFSDENGGNEIDLKRDCHKFCIEYCSYGKLLVSNRFSSTTRDFGQVYFTSREVAQQAIDLFYDDLIKYFTM